MGSYTLQRQHKVILAQHPVHSNHSVEPQTQHRESINGTYNSAKRQLKTVHMEREGKEEPPYQHLNQEEEVVGWDAATSETDFIEE